MKPSVAFKLCHYHSKEYIKYTIKTDDKTITFHNAEYVKIDTTSDTFKEITKCIRGFFANMTTRHIEELKESKHCNIASIMLCCTPQKTNKFLFWFVYLDENDNIKDAMYDSNYFDYQYFCNKLKSAISETGMIFDLENNPKFHQVTKDICLHPLLDFGIYINNTPVKYTDTFKCTDFRIFQEDIQTNLTKLKAKEIRLEFDCNFLNFIHITGTVIDQNNNPIPTWQVNSGITDINEFLQTMKEKYDDNYSINNIDTDPFTFTLNLSTFHTLANRIDKI